MQFSCEKSTLLEAITTASRAVSSKSSIALLEGLLHMLAEEGEDATMDYIRREVLRNRRRKRARR